MQMFVGMREEIIKHGLAYDVRGNQKCSREYNPILTELIDAKQFSVITE